MSTAVKMLQLTMVTCWLVAAPSTPEAASASPLAPLVRIDGSDIASNWDSLRRAGLEACETGRYAESEKIFRRLLDKATESGEDDDRLAASLQFLSIAQIHLGKYNLAEPQLKRAIRIYEKDGTNDADLGSALNNLAWLYASESNLNEAESLYGRALPHLEKGFGSESAEAARCLSDLGSCSCNQHKYENGAKYYERSLRIFEKTFGLYHRSVAIELGKLARCFFEDQKYKLAEPLLERKFDLDKRNKIQPNCPEVASYAKIQIYLKQWSKAEKAFQNWMIVRKKISKLDQTDLKMLRMYSDVLHHVNKTVEARGINATVSDIERRYSLTPEKSTSSAVP